ncbi:hypotheticall protein [Colletotrichum fructicola]|nr:uncharacterized protein CGMCC3_g8023 [Colletotrichum fructicola]KAE9575963.1 hypothetical protein CGMCC3_g8023 [Colletotrichum fructicola]KAF4418246.1 Uncharacterized protein CFRS1_v008168 [Colletotrichum fructicola]KAF4886463.1 hypotheticall protein [Colletotrichum fructicola]KAF4894222.1 hypotheticall protein [Colletotrichum fructicola]KAF4942557.1 hypotheticall protein [Colletotrichum fructicola]
MPPRPPPRTSPTHFLCIPLVTASSRSQLSKSLASFKADVTSPDSFAIPSDAVRPLGTLHLTLGVMSFPKNEGVEKAVEVLQSLKPREILSTVKPLSSITPLAGPASSTPEKPLSLTLRGLHSIQPAQKATVLYAPPIDPDGVFRGFCEKLRGVFQEAEVMDNEDRPLLLHATIVNTIYVKGGRGKKGPRMTIDARDILDRYDDYVWMEDVPVEKIAICRMGAKQIEGVDDQEYEVEAEIDF